jgi:FO synthase
MARLRSTNVSLGLMLENVSERLCQKGMPHHRAPDKRPARRLAMLRDAGKLRIPFTTGILLGIGETRRERVEALLAIADAHREYGHVQEVIVQNFTPHEATRMSSSGAPSDEDMTHAIAMARLVLPVDVSVQSPPNLNSTRTALVVAAGINDFGGISPVTPDYINPDSPWPHVAALETTVRGLGFTLSPRLPIYDSYIHRAGFLDEGLRDLVTRKQANVVAA